MTSFQGAVRQSPWLTVWFSPRQTIDGILASQPRYLVWLMAGLGTIAVFIEQFVFRAGFASPLLLDWRLWFVLLIGGAVFGIAGVYVSALILSWLGKRLSGQASSLELRAVVAWSHLPSVVGVFVALPLLFVWRFLEAGSSIVSIVFLILIFSILAICSLWALIVFLAMLSRVQRFGMARTIVIHVLSAVLLFSVLLLVRTFLFQSFSIPSSSMAPTLVSGDYIFVSKYEYGYSHYSLPWSPRLFAGRIFGSPPARGDIVVFRSSKNDSIDFVKRVLGLPGDRVQMKAGALYVNDLPIPRERLPDLVGVDFCDSDSNIKTKRWRETLANGVSYETLDCVDNGFYDNTEVYTVPMGHFFALGDNRDNSADSRVLSVLGYVPFDNIVGQVKVIFLSTAKGGIFRSERAGLAPH